MRRFLAVAVAVGALVGCAADCPSPACTGWMQVHLSPVTWEPGRYTLVVLGDGLTVQCGITVQQGASAPRAADLDCDHVVDRAAWTLDTGGPLGGVVRVKAPLTTSAAPTTVSVLLERDQVPVDGVSSSVEVLPVAAGRGVCTSTCEGGVVTLTW